MVNKTYKIVIITVFFLINLNALSQNKINNSINYISELEVINPSLFLTLDTIIKTRI